jgi:hypothetical protein
MAGRSLSDWARDLLAVTQAPTVTERHGGDLVAEVLAAHGVEFVFCLSGGHISPILVSSKRKGIRIIDVRHEVSAPQPPCLSPLDRTGQWPHLARMRQSCTALNLRPRTSPRSAAAAVLGRR